MTVTLKLSRLFKKFLNSGKSKVSSLPKESQDHEALKLAIIHLSVESESFKHGPTEATGSRGPEDELECMRQRMGEIIAPAESKSASQILSGSIGPAVVRECEIIDQEMIQRICQYDDGLHGDTLSELIRLFLALTPKRIENLKRALEERSWHCVSKEAHSLKSSSANLGLKRLTAACRKLEAIENHPDYTMAITLLSEIEKEYQAAAGSLMELLEQRVPASLSQVKKRKAAA